MGKTWRKDKYDTTGDKESDRSYFRRKKQQWIEKDESDDEEVSYDFQSGQNTKNINEHNK